MTQPRRQDELLLFNTLKLLKLPCGRRYMEQTFDDLGIPHKRGHYILEKWTGKGWWNYGVNVSCGWFESLAPESLS